MKRWNLFALLLTLLTTTTGISAEPLLPLPTEIWQPAPGTTWQWQLTETVNTAWDVQMYDIDLFDTPTETITALHEDGRIVICYFSAGSYEEWRPDAADFPAEVLGNDLDGWEGERWLDISKINLLSPIMTARLDLAAEKGCDGVEPDNIDGYTNDSGFTLTYQHQIDYNVWLATEAHNRNLSIGLKNDLDQIADLVDDFDWALNEQCFFYEECDLLLPFIEAGKAVFGVEYEGDPEVYCPQLSEMGFSWLTKTLALGDEPPNACASVITPPSVPQLVAPGDGTTINAHAPVFTWTGSGAITFKLTVKTLEGLKVINQSLTAATICLESLCTYDAATDEISLANGVYQWKVVAKNEDGKAKSAKFTFRLEFPGKPVLTSPANDDTVSTTPTIVWGEVTSATEYRVNFKRLADGVKLKGDWTAATLLCEADVCSSTPAAALLPGAYKLWVQARTAGIEHKSSSVKINVQVAD